MIILISMLYYHIINLLFDLDFILINDVSLLLVLYESWGISFEKYIDATKQLKTRPKLPCE